MLKDISYNPDRLFVYHNRESVLETLKETCSKELYETYKSAKVSDAFRKIADGIYEYYDVNSPEMVIDPSYSLLEFGHDDEYENLNIHYPYGVCDDYRQILERDNNITKWINSDDHFIIVLTKISKKNEPETGGWRWHKWGKYIGDHVPQHEYLYDEPDIDYVYVYQMYKVIQES